MNITKYILNTMVLLPSIVLFFYVFPELVHVIDVVPFAVITALPIIKRFLPKKHQEDVYLLALLVIAILVLVSFLVDLNLIADSRFVSLFRIPLDTQTFITLFISVSSVSVIEGILARNVNRAVSALFVSILPLLDQVFTVFLMTQGLSYFAALSEAYSYQFISILALIFTGSTNIDGVKFPPPLSTFQSPLNSFVLVAMIIAIIGFILYFILVVDDRHRSETVSLMSAPIFVGAVIGVITFAAIVILESVNLQLLGGAVAVMATLIYMSRSSPERRRKRQKKKATVISK
ncbi:MAG: hypothetical protein M1616_06180 [Candidatus Thermoplasmatota archaeon]|nr:hypothetical protein [Candidatus Thermoplasmatota archaeon]